MRKLLLILAALGMSQIAWGRTVQTQAMLNVRSADGTVSNYPYQLKIASGTLVDNTDGTMTLITISSAPLSSYFVSTAFVPYRRPNLVFNSSITVVDVESGLDGTAGDVQILFPDGSLITETSKIRYQLCLSSSAVYLTSATMASGMLSSEFPKVSNTYYSVYAVKVSTDFIVIADTTEPITANFANLNTTYGSNKWVFLGTVRNGDQSASINGIVKFTQSNGQTYLRNQCTGSAVTSVGIRVATTASAASLTYTYAAGTTGTSIPSRLTIGTYGGFTVAVAGFDINTAAGIPLGGAGSTSNGDGLRITNTVLADGLQVAPSATVAQDIYLQGWIDPALTEPGNQL